MDKIKTVLTLTSNDQGVSWGPAIHYLELWNEVSNSGLFVVKGHAPSWTRKKPIIDQTFNLRRWHVPNVRGLRQVFWDIHSFFIIMFGRYDILYLRLSGMHMFAWLAIKIRQPVLALELNGLAEPDQKAAKGGLLKRLIFTTFQNRLLKEAKLCFSVSSSIKEYAKSISPNSRHVLVDNGVSEKFFSVKSENEPNSEKIKAIYVGTFTPWDGAADIIELASKFPRVEFLMVGDGELRRPLQARAPKNVTFSGWVSYSALPNYYARSNVAIVLYEQERHQKVTVSSLKTREYIASGLPVFSTRVPGQEFIEEKGYGLLSKGSAVDDFSRFLDQRKKFEENLRQNKLQIFRLFSWTAVSKKTATFLSELV